MIHNYQNDSYAVATKLGVITAGGAVGVITA